MEYRINKRTGDKISVLGFGTSYIAQADEKDAIATIRQAYEGGVNYFDLATAESRTFPYFGAALGDVRKNVRYQIHFGANYQGGPMASPWTPKPSKKASTGSWRNWAPITLITASSTVWTKWPTGGNTRKTVRWPF